MIPNAFLSRRQFIKTTSVGGALAAVHSARANEIRRDLLDIRGNQIVKDEKPIRLRGTNLGNWMILEHYMMGLPSVEYHMRSVFRRMLGEDRFHAFFDTFMDASIRESDIAFLKECGFTLLQVPFNYRHFLCDGTTDGFEPRGFEYLDKVIALCRQHGLYVLLSCHAAPGCIARDWNAESICGEVYFWHHDHFQDRTADLWRTIASRYVHEPVVMGYELLNEPVADNLNVFHRVNLKLLHAIREVDTQHIVVINANMWGKRIDSLREDLFEDPRTMPSTHAYPTTQDPWRSLTSLPGVFQGKAVGEEQLIQFLEPRHDERRIHRPLLLGEFGTPKDCAIRTELLDAMLGVFEKMGWHWTSWDYKDLGFLGIVHPKPETPWVQFVTSQPVQRITKAFTDYTPSLKAHFAEAVPQFSAADLFLLAYQSQHHFDTLALPLVIGLLKDRSASDLKAMAESYAFENCQIDSDRHGLFVRHARAGKP